ncbi:MAG: HisA/HisF-related TIM barrel protein [Promethearchaeota archaeon]
MASFKIIPVIDILNSEAVHAIKGERNKYRPLQSKLFKSSNPIEIIKDLKQRIYFNEFYIADLDAIINKKPNWDLYAEILKSLDVDIIIDPGIAYHKDLLLFSKFNFSKLILGLETINSFQLIYDAIKIVGTKKLIISIDMYKGKIISNIKEIKNQLPLRVTKQIEEIGIKEIILLDLFRVGQKLGGIPSVYLEILHSFEGNVLVGGGIKNLNDILDYKQRNFSGVLIATALYDGTLNIDKLKSLKQD